MYDELRSFLGGLPVTFMLSEALSHSISSTIKRLIINHVEKLQPFHSSTVTDPSWSCCFLLKKSTPPLWLSGDVIFIKDLARMDRNANMHQSISVKDEHGFFLQSDCERSFAFGETNEQRRRKAALLFSHRLVSLKFPCRVAPFRIAASCEGSWMTWQNHRENIIIKTVEPEEVIVCLQSCCRQRGIQVAASRTNTHTHFCLLYLSVRAQIWVVLCSTPNYGC